MVPAPQASIGGRWRQAHRKAAVQGGWASPGAQEGLGQASNPGSFLELFCSQ